MVKEEVADTEAGIEEMVKEEVVDIEEDTEVMEKAEVDIEVNLEEDSEVMVKVAEVTEAVQEVEEEEDFIIRRLEKKKEIIKNSIRTMIINTYKKKSMDIRANFMKEKVELVEENNREKEVMENMEELADIRRRI